MKGQECNPCFKKMNDRPIHKIDLGFSSIIYLSEKRSVILFFSFNAELIGKENYILGITKEIK